MNISVGGMNGTLNMVMLGSHMSFHAFTFAGSRGSRLNTTPLVGNIKCNINANMYDRYFCTFYDFCIKNSRQNTLEEY